MSKLNQYNFLKKTLFTVILSLSLAVFPASAKAKNSKKAPDWITGQSKAYPKAEYLTASGVADSKRAAELDAINELAAVFGQKITSATLASKRLTMAQSQGLVASSSESSLAQDILREVSQDDIIAVEIPEFYEAKSEGKWYALAVINKSKASQIYSGMIEKNQKEVEAIIMQIQKDKEADTMLNFSRLDFAEEVAKKNETYLKRLTVLDPKEAEKFSAINTPVQIHKMKIDMAARIPVCVNVDDDSDGRITKSFQEVMTSFGFNTTIGSNERYIISCKNHFTESASSNAKTKFCEYAAECALIDTFLGETLIPLSITGREGSTTYQNAEVRAKQKIVTKIKSEFAAGFQKYLGDFSAF